MTRAAGQSSHYSFYLEGRDEVISLPSVTSILNATLAKPYLVPWGFKMGLQAAQQLAEVLPDGLEIPYSDLYQAAKERELTPNQIRDKAGDKGTNIHEFFEAMVMIPPKLVGDTPPMASTKDELALWTWWSRQKVAKVIACEKPVWSLEHGYAGTLDLLYRETPPDIGRPEGRAVLLDLKSSGTVSADFVYQVAAYWHAAKSQFGVTAEAGMILHIKDGKVTEYWFTQDELAEGFKVFLHVLSVYKARGQNGSR